MKRIIDEENKTIWYYSQSGFPTYMAISSYRKQSPSYEHCIASKESWKRLCEKHKPIQSMKIALAIMLACSGNYIDPDGQNVFFYEECLHMNRGKFTEELHQKCKKYSDIKLQESSRI